MRRNTDEGVHDKGRPNIVKVNIDGLSEDAKREVLAEYERHERIRAEKQRRLRAIKEAAKIRAGTPGSPLPDASLVGGPQGVAPDQRVVPVDMSLPGAGHYAPAASRPSAMVRGKDVKRRTDVDSHGAPMGSDVSDGRRGEPMGFSGVEIVLVDADGDEVKRVKP